MHKSFLDLVLESNQIEEMALNPENFPETYLKKAKDRQAIAREIMPLAKQFQEALANLNWREITWSTRGSSYYPILPAPILAIYMEAKQKVGGGDSFLNGVMNENFGKWADANNQSDCIHMEVDSSGRSHFPGGGIPRALRGARLGYKLYRALLEQKKWLKSNTAGTLEKDNAWASLISPKLNADGSLSDDDVHAILGPDSVFAMIKTISNSEKIRFATNFLDNNISYSSVNTRNFGIDDELKAILPADYMARFDPAERERLERERREREQREQAERARQYGIERGIQWEDQPEIGDLVYVRNYAANRDTSIPMRIIVGERGGNVYALDLRQFLIWRDQSNSDMSELSGFDTRSCANNPESIKTYFAKVDPAQLPGLEDDSTVIRSRYSSSDWQGVKDFIMSMIDPELAARMRAEREERERTEREERERAEAERQAQRAQNEERFGPSYDNFSDAEYKTALETRQPGNYYITKLFKRGTLTDIALSPDQVERFNRRKSTPVFLPAQGGYFNSINGFKIDEPIDGLGLTRFRLERFDSKRATTPNEMLYIANHSTYYGIVAPVDYFVFNQSRNEEYIYLRVYDNTSGRARKIAIKVGALRKIVAY